MKGQQSKRTSLKFSYLFVQSCIFVIQVCSSWKQLSFRLNYSWRPLIFSMQIPFTRISDYIQRNMPSWHDLWRHFEEQEVKLSARSNMLITVEFSGHQLQLNRYILTLCVGVLSKVSIDMTHHKILVSCSLLRIGRSSNNIKKRIIKTQRNTFATKIVSATTTNTHKIYFFLQYPMQCCPF